MLGLGDRITRLWHARSAAPRHRGGALVRGRVHCLRHAHPSPLAAQLGSPPRGGYPTSTTLTLATLRDMCMTRTAPHISRTSPSSNT